MKKTLGLILLVPLLFGGLSACGGGDDTATTETTAAAPADTMEPSMEASADETMAASSAVEEYCQKVDEYAAAAKELMSDPTSGDATELQQKAQELQDTASNLTQELIDDPSQASRVQECTTKLQEALAG